MHVRSTFQDDVAEYKRQFGAHPARLQVVDHAMDGVPTLRTVEVRPATTENLRFLTQRAETFAECGVPAMVGELLSVGATEEFTVTRNHFFGVKA